MDRICGGRGATAWETGRFVGTLSSWATNPIEGMIMMIVINDIIDKLEGAQAAGPLSKYAYHAYYSMTREEISYPRYQLSKFISQ